MPDRVLAPFGSPRLLYRPFTDRDVPAAFALFSDPEVMRFSLSGRQSDPAQAAAEIARHAIYQTELGYSCWAIVERRDERVIGLCGLVPLPEGGVEIAYRLRRDRWGHGFATEAAGAWLEQGTTVLALPRITAFVAPENTASERVLLKVGMRFVEKTLYHGIAVYRYVKENSRQMSA